MDYLRAFITGGALCVIAQILIDKTRMSPGRILVFYVTAGVVLGAVGLYGPFVEYAGGGATVPLTGFGYLISKGVKEAIDAEGAVGILKGGISATAGGITAALFFGAVVSLFSRSKPKR